MAPPHSDDPSGPRDPVADLLAMGMAYREFARANLQLYRLMFAVDADARPAGSDDRGLGDVLAPLTTNLLVGLGDTPEAVDRSLTALIEDMKPPGNPPHR